MQIRIFLLLVAFQSCAGFGSASPIHLTFSAVAAEVSLNGSPSVKTDLSVSLLANTASIMPGGGMQCTPPPSALGKIETREI